MPGLLGFGPPDPPDRGVLARDALTRGQGALAAGDRGEAVRWLDRACRLVPEDPVLTLTLAGACVGLDEARAERLFTSVADRWTVREAWLGLAGTRRNLGDRAGAAAALAHALAWFAAVAGFDWLADAVARESGAPGWCGVAGGKAIVRPGDRGGVAELYLGDRAIGAVPAGMHVLPRGAGGERHLHVRCAGRPLLGSPVMLSSIMRSEGFVEAQDGGVAGWLWHPCDPDRDPVVSIQAVEGAGRLRVQAVEPASLPLLRGFTRARSFHVSAERLAAAGLMPACGLRVRGADGRDLLGSPLNPGWERLAAEAAAELIAAQFAPGRLRVIRKQKLGSSHSDENGDLWLPVDSRFRGNDRRTGNDGWSGDDGRTGNDGRAGNGGRAGNEGRGGDDGWGGNGGRAGNGGARPLVRDEPRRGRQPASPFRRHLGHRTSEAGPAAPFNAPPSRCTAPAAQPRGSDRCGGPRS